MSHSHQTSLIQVGKLINIIPVGLKEAAVDSPTFRATTVHFSEQVDLIERWVDDYLKTTNKLIAECATIENVIGSFISHALLPNSITEAVLDHDYSILALRKYGEGAKEFWMSTVAVTKRLPVIVIEPIRSFLLNDLRAFKDVRRTFEQSQKNFDTLEMKYASQGKSKEPSSLREDAFQLHEARKAYLKASMDYCVVAPQLRAVIDRLVIGLVTDQWREMRLSRESSGATFARGALEMDRVRGWIREMDNSDKAFKRELHAARKHLEETAELAARPSRELDDYSISNVPYLGHRPSASHGNVAKVSGGDEVKKSGIEGWLHLRTFSGKPVRSVWVRRWAFVKNGIFGWLLQAARGGGVEESERIGVLLCNVRPAVQEERRFCFEVKTKNHAIMLQTATQADLIEWITVFENAKSKALEDPASNGPLAGNSGVSDPAFVISPPSVPEFGSLVLDTVNPGSKDDEPNAPDRSNTVNLSGNEAGGDISRKGTGQGTEGVGLRDHAARAMSKVDLPRRSPANLLANAATSSPMGGIASLIAASHSSMPVGPGSPARPVEAEKVKGKVTFTLASRDMPPHTLAPSTLINPPAPTQLSKQAVIVSGELGAGFLSGNSGGIPGALLANMWGSSHWAYFNRLEGGELKVPPGTRLSEQHSPLIPPSSSPSKGSGASQANENPNSLPSSATGRRSINERSRNPTPPPGRRITMSMDSESAKALRTAIASQDHLNYYPLQLKTQDAQFRLLFPNVSRDEKLLLVFRATWNPDNEQDFPGRAYVTTDVIYFYSHYLGLVLTSGVRLSTVEEVTAAPGRDCDFLFLHMRDVGDESGSTRITIKTFLEPLKPLQRRLNYLVRNSGVEEPPDLETVIQALTQMGSQRATRSSSSGSWEAVSISTPVDDGTSGGLHRSKPRVTDKRFPVRIDRSLENDLGKGAPKFKLPAQPVVYTPAGNLHKAVEKNFDISPKALFHVLFGDRSAVWQLLQQERRAKNLRQGPWVSIGEGHLRRDFDFDVTIRDSFGRTKDVQIKDYQVINVLNDHLCYVVTDKRTAWYLQYRHCFKMVSKIVITHVGKSKSKLAVFTKVEWVRKPWILKGVIEKQAEDDVELDALDLVDLVTDQARRLGPYSRTKKAIQIFGQVAQSSSTTQLQVGKTAVNIETRRQPIQRTMFGLLLQSCGSFLESTITSFLRTVIDVVRWVWKTSSANSVILALLMMSALVNGFYSSRDSWEWWHERKATRFMAKMGIQADTVMSKAVYVLDIDDMVASRVDFGSSEAAARPCYSTFYHLNQLDDADAPLPSDPATKKEAHQIQRTRRRLGSYRHDLLVAMRVVDSIEKEVVQAGWERWVQGEHRRCRQLAAMLEQKNNNNETMMVEWRGKGEEEEARMVQEWYGDYCADCQSEYRSLFAGAW